MSAVIYAAIVVMWAVVLVPMWLRRHDAATESRSVDRFSTAMRTLSRRTSATPGRRYVVMPRRGEGRVAVHVSGAAAVKRPPRPTVQTRPGPARPARGRPSLVARRRRLLLGILAVTFITLLLAAVGVISWPLQIVVDVIPVAFCLHLRAQARRAVAVARQRRRVAVASDVPVAAPAAPRWTMPAPAAPAAEQQPVAATGTDDTSADDTVTWEPVPVPRPTYTMKPPAPAYEADPTYSPPVYSPDSEPAEPGVEVVAAADGETDLDEILERRWAVND